MEERHISEIFSGILTSARECNSLIVYPTNGDCYVSFARGYYRSAILILLGDDAHLLD